MTTMNSTEIKERDKQYVLGTYARNDLCIAKGSGATCWSPEGGKYIDFSSGIGVNVFGFCDKGWIDAVTRQLQTLQHTSNLFYTEPCGELAEMLVKRTGFDKVFFCNSGAEANEGAIKAARKYSYMKYGKGRHEIITLMNSFHGRTMTTITATGQEHYHKYFDPFPEGFLYAAINDPKDIKGKITDKTCAVMAEFVQGEGGVNDLDRDYVKAVYELCKEKDILFIADEVQTGIGRTGKLFAYEHLNRSGPGDPGEGPWRGASHRCDPVWERLFPCAFGGGSRHHLRRKSRDMRRRRRSAQAHGRGVP